MIIRNWGVTTRIENSNSSSNEGLVFVVSSAQNSPKKILSVLFTRKIRI